jgi:Flp pilus assembly protein TadD
MIMTKPLRFGTAVSAIAMIGVLGGCASPGSNRAKSASIFGGKVDTSNIGLATRASAALVAGDTASAISLAERAVEGSPNDAGFRALLGNIYFTSGRFASAESAYRGSIALLSGQPAIVLKLALVQIAQGKNDQALALLEAARGVLDTSDHGLALALAGQPNQAIEMLEPAARQPGADSRVRQNLALAYAFAGDWTAARMVASQDVPAEQLDARIQQWMVLAKPAKASDQVAALIGVTPAVDPGQPVRLALKGTDERMAQLVPMTQPVAEPSPEAAPVMAAVEAPQPAPQPVEIAAVAPQPAPAAEAVFTPAAAPVPTSVATVHLAPPKPVARAPRAAPPVRNASAPMARPAFRRAALPLAKSINTVVQLAAYDSRAYVADGWNRMARRYGALRSYSPVVAQFNSPRGLVYRLSVKGFASTSEAKGLCQSLRRSGGACFVRSVAGDAPVRIASR